MSWFLGPCIAHPLSKESHHYFPQMSSRAPIRNFHLHPPNANHLCRSPSWEFHLFKFRLRTGVLSCPESDAPRTSLYFHTITHVPGSRSGTCSVRMQTTSSLALCPTSARHPHSLGLITWFHNISGSMTLLPCAKARWLVSCEL